MQCRSCRSQLPVGVATCPTCGAATPYNLSDSGGSPYDLRAGSLPAAAPQQAPPPPTVYGSPPYGVPQQNPYVPPRSYTMYPQDYASVQQIRYYSKIDAWMVVVLCVGLLLPMILAVLGISSLTLPGISPGGSAVILLILVGPFVGVVALVLGLACPVYYEITPSTLLVRSGLLRRQIPLASISQVFPTHSPVSGPAWSFDRLQVDYMHNGQLRSVLISPKDKLRFLHDLVSRAAGLEIRGERVVRRRWTHLSSSMEKPTDPLENVPGQKGPFFSPSRLVNVVAPLMLALQVLLTLLIYPLLPSIVPSHWDAAGHINSYSSKGAYVSFLPIFSLVLYVFLRVMFAFIGSQSRGQNLRMGQNILTFVIVGQQGLFLIIQAVLLLVALHAGGGSVRSL